MGDVCGYLCARARDSLNDMKRKLESASVLEGPKVKRVCISAWPIPQMKTSLPFWKKKKKVREEKQRRQLIGYKQFKRSDTNKEQAKKEGEGIGEGGREGKSASDKKGSSIIHQALVTSPGACDCT